MSDYPYSCEGCGRNVTVRRAHWDWHLGLLSCSCNGNWCAGCYEAAVDDGHIVCTFED